MESMLDKFLELKMYYFNPNNYGAEYFTIAPNSETALNNVKSFLLKKASIGEGDKQYCYTNLYTNDYNVWKDATITNLPSGYTIDEYKNGDVVESELC